MMSTSWMSGTLVILVVPRAKSAAAISFRTEFLAPWTLTDPVSARPPVTLRTSPAPSRDVISTGASYEREGPIWPRVEPWSI